MNRITNGTPAPSAPAWIGWGEVLLFLVISLVNPAQADSTINAVQRHAYGANLGWIDWRAENTHGAVIDEYVCSGYLYSANVGWIHLGSGQPDNGVRYQNDAANDFGVNHDGAGNLRGYAYGANIGWIHFEDTGAPQVDLQTGHLSGFLYSANCGWISLSNTSARVQTDTIAPGGDADGNGLPDAWEHTHFGSTGVDPDDDPDKDGLSNQQEYLADTDPRNGVDLLRITAFSFDAAGAQVSLTWLSRASRNYYLEQTDDLTMGPWLDSGLGLVSPDGSSTTRSWQDDAARRRFYRVRAVRPLAP